MEMPPAVYNNNISVLYACAPNAMCKEFFLLDDLYAEVGVCDELAHCIPQYTPRGMVTGGKIVYRDIQPLSTIFQSLSWEDTLYCLLQGIHFALLGERVPHLYMAKMAAWDEVCVSADCKLLYVNFENWKPTRPNDPRSFVLQQNLAAATSIILHHIQSNFGHNAERVCGLCYDAMSAEDGQTPLGLVTLAEMLLEGARITPKCRRILAWITSCSGTKHGG